jgi:CubicO group peptidase (beta-lactamase class C family)
VALIGFSTDRLARLDGAMQAEIDAGHYAAVSVMVARHSKLVKFRCYGPQKLGGSEPLRQDAIFRIASMTKSIIAVAMMLLYEEGKWQLDDRQACEVAPGSAARNLLPLRTAAISPGRYRPADRGRRS